MPGSLITTILATLATTLDAVTGVQRVHAYEPIATAPADIVAIMGGSQAVDYWSIKPETTRTTRLAGYQQEIDHVILITHYYTVSDVTVTTPLLHVIILAVMNALNAVFSIAPQAERSGPVEVTWPVYWMIGGSFLVHKTEYRYPVKELVVIQ